LFELQPTTYPEIGASRSKVKQISNDWSNLQTSQRMTWSTSFSSFTTQNNILAEAMQLWLTKDQAILGNTPLQMMSLKV